MTDEPGGQEPRRTSATRGRRYKPQVLELADGSRLVLAADGAIDHIAFNCEGLKETVGQLERDGVKYDIRKVPGRPLQQVFIHDPDGVMLELNFRNEPA